MKLQEILEQYDTALLDHIAADKVDETITLRLPHAVIIQEIISALSSQSYISNKILYGKPPTYAILNLILQSPESMVPIDGFQAQVVKYVDALKDNATSRKVSSKKDALLYIKILQRAWENDNIIDKSEAYILELVRQELGVWDREHYVLMHDESIIGFWSMDQEYYNSRNQLLSSGILLIHGNFYVIADEVANQIQKAFGIELRDESFLRLLEKMPKDDLSAILEHFQLNVSGVKAAMADRILKSLIPPTEVLNVLHLEKLRELCRQEAISLSGSKSTLIASIIQHFKEGKDLVRQVPQEVENKNLHTEPEVREMNPETYYKILTSLTGQQLYDILYQCGIMTSGTKDEKIRRIMESRWSERSTLSLLRREDLSLLCRKYAQPVSGSKQELVDRLLDYVPLTSLEHSDVTFTDSHTEPPIINKSEMLVDEVRAGFQPVALPSNWEMVSTDFSELSHAEKIVLAILIDAKSLTERDVERVVSSHKLNWFLYKANMAELIAKLKRNGRASIQIKSVQNSNIYQWTGFDKRSDILERKAARDIIDALRHGVVPGNNLNLLIVGQHSARKHLSEILMEVNGQKSHFKFIRGEYGSGKTFLCSWLKEFALEKEFAVSFMNISHDQPLSDLPVFFSGMINGLRTPEKTDSSALVDILESWLLNIHNATSMIESVDSYTVAQLKDLNDAVEKSIELELANLNDIEPGFSQAIRSFYKGKVNGNTELVSNAVAWITGSRALSSQALREIGVKGYLEANNVFPRMRTILEVINGARYKGLLLLIDELELIRKFPHARQREQALESLRMLIDEAGRNALPGCLIIFTGTDEFFEDERYGLKSYQALADRVMAPLVHESFVSMRQPIINLESLDKERLGNVLLKIRDLYGIAYGWDAVKFADDLSINRLIDEWTLFGNESVERKPRPVLREFIQMLDLCEENKGVHLSQFIKQTQMGVLSESTIHTN